MLDWTTEYIFYVCFIRNDSSIHIPVRFSWRYGPFTQYWHLVSLRFVALKIIVKRFIEMIWMFCFVIWLRLRWKDQHKRLFASDLCTSLLLKVLKEERMNQNLNVFRMFVFNIRWWIWTNAMLWYRNMSHVRLSIKWCFDW